MILIPAVIKETSAGYERCSIQDMLFQNREIECVGPITSGLVQALILQLKYLQKEDKYKEITMYVNSCGGSVTEGLALYDAMQAITCPIRTVCIGQAASMGAAIFASGSIREILPHARVMIHDPLISRGVSGTALKIERTAEDLMKIREIMGKILAKHTGRKLSEIYKRTAQDSYFTATEAVEFGLADRVIRTI